MKLKQRSTISLNMFLTILLVGIMLNPYLSINYNGYILIAIFALWASSCFLFCKWSTIVSNPLFLWPSLFLLYQFFMLIIGLSTISIENIIVRMPIYYIPLYARLVIRKYKKIELIILSKLILFIYFINILIVVITTNSETTNNEEGLFIATNFVLLVAATSLIILFLLMNSANKNNLLYKFILLMNIYYLVLLNSRFIAISILLMCIAIMFFIQYIWQKKSNKIYRIVFILIILLIILFNLINIISLFGYIEGNDWMQEKVDDLTALLKGNKITSYGSLSQRISLYGISIETFTSSFSNLILGGGEKAYPVANNYYANLYGVGGHSELFDMLAEYGILGFILVITWLIHIYKKQIYNSDKRIKNQIRTVWLFILLYGVVNNFIYGNLFCMAFLYLPIKLKLMNFEYIKDSLI